MSEFVVGGVELVDMKHILHHIRLWAIYLFFYNQILPFL